jgi:dUTP pyrophosphatase
LQTQYPTSRSVKIQVPHTDFLPQGALSSTALRSLITGDPPLIRSYRDLDSQIQPNGFDLTLESVAIHRGAGAVGHANVDRVLPDLEPVDFDQRGWVDLQPGIYHITYNEIVALPLSVMALGRPRSTLNRIGATIHTAVWDAGYEGRSTSLLAVMNSNGVQLQRDARVMQLVFFAIGEPPGKGYAGIYQGENVNR